jgi:hypothetical protein
MNKGKIIAFRLSDTLHRDLIQMAETQGCTISDVARNIITGHLQGEHLLRALEETRKSLSQEISQVRAEMKGVSNKTGIVNSESSDDIKLILRIVKSMGRGSVFTSKDIPHLLADDEFRHRP